MTAKLCCIALLLLTMRSTGVEVRILNSVQSKGRSTHVVKDGQPVDVELRTVRLSIVLPSGKPGYGDATMLYEPKTKLFWWFYQSLERPDDGVLPTPLDGFVVYIADDKVVGFNLDLSVLSVRDSTSHFLSLDEGQTKVLERIKEYAERIEKGSMRWSRTVRLGPALPDFFVLKGSAAPPHATIRRVSREDSGWRVILDGPNKNSAEVVLDDEYQLVRGTVLTSDAR